jgi:acylphosphatase
MKAARFLVRGKVQGVFFRASAQQRATELGLTGHARNLIDGSVEVVAQGEADALETLAEWLRVGPPSARVDELYEEPLEPIASREGFVIR